MSHLALSANLTQNLFTRNFVVIIKQLNRLDIFINRSIDEKSISIIVGIIPVSDMHGPKA
jgi:hypothetical protein